MRFSTFPTRALPLLLASCTCYQEGVERTRCHEEGQIPFVDLRPYGVKDGVETIWIRGTVPGVSQGQVRFFEEVDGALELICLGVICDETFEIEAPADADAPVHISVVDLASGEPVDSSHQWGALDSAILLDGTDHRVEVQIGTVAGWVDKVQIQADRIASVDQVLRREKPPPP